MVDHVTDVAAEDTHKTGVTSRIRSVENVARKVTSPKFVEETKPRTTHHDHMERDW